VLPDGYDLNLLLCRKKLLDFDKVLTQLLS